MQNDINLESMNALVPFLPSNSWEISAYSVNIAQSRPTFSWIQVLFDAQAVPNPVLAVYSGHQKADGTPIVSPVYFAYSGERVFFKGVLVLTSGTDRDGNTITSTDIGDLSKIIAYGGVQ